MASQTSKLDKKTLEDAFAHALRSVLGETGSGFNPRAQFYKVFQKEMEEHDLDLEKKYDGDLNTTLIFSGLFSAVTSAFIINIQSELSPDYQKMNNVLLERLLNATTGTLPANSAPSVPRWSGPDPTIVQVQCVLYATLCATLLASFLAMLGKQWLNRYKQNETRGSAADRSRLRERKLTGLQTWNFHLVMESLPLILQFALVLLGSSLSRYLWEVNRSVSSVVMGFTCFGFLFFSLIVTASLFSFSCPFQTPLSLLIHSLIGLAIPYWRTLQKSFTTPQQPPQAVNLLLPTDGLGGDDLEAGLTVPTPAADQPLFVQRKDLEGDRSDAKCINRLFELSTDVDVVLLIMDFIPEVIWHGGIKAIPLNRIYDILVDCFDFSSSHPVLIPKSRDVAYRSARAFVHIELQRRCITHYDGHNQDSWRVLCRNHRPLLPENHEPDPDLATALFMVDLTLGHRDDKRIPWKELEMTPPHHAWISHVFLYHAWHEGEVTKIVTDFVEDSMSLDSPGDVVTADCFIIIGLMIGVSVHVNDLTVRDKSRERAHIIASVFTALTEIFTQETIQMATALNALGLATRLSRERVITELSYVLFKLIMASNELTDQHWEAARFAVDGACSVVSPSVVGEPKELVRFLDYHIVLRGSGEDHESYITPALEELLHQQDLDDVHSLTFQCIRGFNWTSPSFVRGICSMIQPQCNPQLRGNTTCLIALVSDTWFDRVASVMNPQEISEFGENMALFMDQIVHQTHTKKNAVAVLFGMLRSPSWREHIVTRFWKVLAYCNLVGGLEVVKLCLENAIQLLEFTKGLSLSDDGEGLKWWYGTLWFYYHKLSPTVQAEVKKVAEVIPRNHLNLYLNLIEDEAGRLRKELNELPEEEIFKDHGINLRDQLVGLQGNYDQLAQIAGRTR